MWLCPAALAGVIVGAGVLRGQPSRPAAEHAVTLLLTGPLLLSSAMLSWRAAHERLRTYSWLHTLHATIGYALLALALMSGAIATVVVSLCWTYPEARSAIADWTGILAMTAAVLRVGWAWATRPARRQMRYG